MKTASHLSRRQLLALLATAPLPLFAQGNSSPAPPVVELRGVTPNGQHLTLDALRGRVVLVFFWSTNCPVCRNKMPELRANAAGWQGQDFTLLGVNMDEKQEEFLRYEEVVKPLLKPNEWFPSVWGRDPAYHDSIGPISHLPTAALIDKRGLVAERYSGRIPPQAWNRIADLL